MKKVFFLTFLFLAFSLSPVSAKNFEILTGEWAPYVSEKMKEGGPTAIIVSEAIKAAGHTLSFKYVPWERAKMMTQNGKDVASFPWSVSDGFQKTCFVSPAITSQSMVFFYMKEKLGDWDYKDFDQLKKLKVGGAQGYTYVDTFKNAGVKPEYAPDIVKALTMLVHGRIDVVPESEIVGWQTIKTNLAEYESKFATSKTPLFVKPLHLMVSKAHPDGQELMDAYEKGFEIIKANGVYKKLLEEYGLTE